MALAMNAILDEFLIRIVDHIVECVFLFGLRLIAINLNTSV